MTKDDIKKTFSHSRKKNLYFINMYLPNLEGKKSVYSDKISMSGRSDIGVFFNILQSTTAAKLSLFKLE